MTSDTKQSHNIAVVIPAYNEAEGIDVTLSDLKPFAGEFSEIIVVDDGSTDDTAKIAASHGVTVISHKRNKGYGAAIKTGVRNSSADYILIMDSDGQHNPNDIKKIIDDCGEYDMIVGERTKDSQKQISRQPGKKVLSLVANFLANYKIPDLNSGFRLIKRSLVEEFSHILPNGFSFSTTITIAALKAGYDIRYVPITTSARIGRKSNVKMFRDGFNTLMLIIRIVALFDPLRVFLPMSIVLFIIGVVYIVICSIQGLNIPDGAVLTILASCLMFFFGILSDQISMMRREKK